MVSYSAIFAVVGIAYRRVLRPLIVKAVEDPDEKWDDFLLQLLDKIFDATS